MNRHEVAARQALTEMYGPEGAGRVWAAACDGLPGSPDRPHGYDELLAIAQTLIDSGGLGSIIGRTLKIRVLTQTRDPFDTA